VTIGDVLVSLWKDYQKPVKQAEIDSLHPRLQERIARLAAVTNRYGSAVLPVPQRADWLLNHRYFDSLSRDDDFAITRLGFRAPNILKLDLVPEFLQGTSQVQSVGDVPSKTQVDKV